MKKVSFLFASLSLLFVTTSSIGQGSCQQDYRGVPFCAPPGGTAVQTIIEVVCAVGKCVADNQGYLKCSDVVGGGATKDYQGNVFCVGNCVSPSKDLCKQMKVEKK